jgi:hypothetical protein
VGTVSWQLSLFEADAEVPSTRLEDETRPTLSPMRDTRRVIRLGKLAAQLGRANEPLDQARLAVEIRDLAESVVVDCVREASDAGWTWRQIGEHLGIGFQTLSRRYGKPTAG